MGLNDEKERGRDVKINKDNCGNEKVVPIDFIY